MNLKIDDKDYSVPMLNAADYEDHEDLIRKVGDDTLHYLERNKAAVAIIVAKMQATYPGLEDARQIKQAITMPKMWALFGWITAGKNGEAQPKTDEPPKS